MRRNRKIIFHPYFYGKNRPNALFFCIFALFYPIFVSHETHSHFWIVPRETYIFDPFSSPISPLFSVILAFMLVSPSFSTDFTMDFCGFLAISAHYHQHIPPDHITTHRHFIHPTGNQLTNSSILPVSTHYTLAIALCIRAIHQRLYYTYAHLCRQLTLSFIYSSPPSFTMIFGCFDFDFDLDMLFWAIVGRFTAFCDRF